MKHAYLILAHHEFGILQCLLDAIDDPRNDIYIHFDKKLKILPDLLVKKSNLYILSERVDVRWGDVTVVEAEYALFEAAKQQGNYTYYHLMSGVDMPLKSQDIIHDFFAIHSGKEFIGFSNYDYAAEVDRKVNRIHLFSKDFRDKESVSGKIKMIVRALFLRLQLILGVRRHQNLGFKKGTQWVSLTSDFVSFILTRRNEVLKTYQNTFCSDEIFIQTLCWNSDFRDQVFDLNDEGRSSLRAIQWVNGELIDWEEKDFQYLMQANELFARKFNSTHMIVVKRILSAVKS